MQVIFDLFNLIFFGPIVNLLVLLIRLLSSVGIPGTLGITIILLTIAIRLLIWPFFASQIKSAKKMADLKPHLDKLKQIHSSDKQALAQAQMALYKEHGVNPAGGCLPSLIQIPVLIALYQVILAMFDGTHGLDKINSFLYNPGWRLENPPDPYFLGLNLGSRPSDFATAGLVVLSIPFITALLQFFQSKMMMASPVKKYPSDSPKEKKEKEGVEDTMQAVQSQMIYMMPIMIGYFAFSFPVGLALYWNTFTLIGIYQQYKISGWGGLSSLVNNLKIKK